MKKCAYCGKEYPDQMTTCPQDGNPLPVPPAAGPSPLQVPSSGLTRTSLILGCALVFIALLAGLLLPALARAKYKAEQINCVSRLMSIDLAYRIWADDHTNNLPHSILDLTNELGTPDFLICPADHLHARARDGSPVDWNPANFSYEFLGFGVPQDQVLNRVIVRCPIHTNELRGDGSVMVGGRALADALPGSSWTRKYPARMDAVPQGK